MKLKTLPILTALCLTSPLWSAGTVQAEGKLTVYCSVQNTTCEKMIQAFAQKYNVETQFVRNSTGATLAKIKAEQGNPQADIWYGGTIEPHFQAGDLGLLEPYRSPKQAEIMPQFKTLMDKKGDLTSIGYMLVLGFGVNTFVSAASTTFATILGPRPKIPVKVTQVFKKLLRLISLR